MFLVRQSLAFLSRQKWRWPCSELKLPLYSGRLMFDLHNHFDCLMPLCAARELRKINLDYKKKKKDIYNYIYKEFRYLGYGRTTGFFTLDFSSLPLGIQVACCCPLTKLVLFTFALFSGCKHQKHGHNAFWDKPRPQVFRASRRDP